MTTPIHRSFSGGEISPSLYARVDTVKYQTGLRTCRNFFVQRHGGAANRAGTKYIAEVKDSSATARLIPFVFNSDQTYVLEFGNQYIRFYRNQAQITLTGQTITGITQADPCVVTITSHGLSNGDELYFSGVGGMVELNGRNFLISNASTHTFEITYLDGTDVDSTGFTAFTSGGTAAEVYQITSPYVTADLATLQFVQSADVITIAHPNYAPRTLSRTGHTSWTLASITFSPDVDPPTSLNGSGGTAGNNTSYVVTAIAAETFEESLQSNTYTTTAKEPDTANPIALTWTAPSGDILEYNVYRQLNGVFGFIGIAGSNAFSDNGITPDTSISPPVSRTLFNSTDNYPSAVSYIQQRLAFANTNNAPEKIWMSQTGNFYNFNTSSPIQDDDALTFNIVGRQVNEVNHILDLGFPVVMTRGGEWTLNGNDAGILKPAEINPKQHSYNGSAELSPILIDGTALYLQERGSIVRDLAFDFQVDGYRGNDLTIFSSHLFDEYSIVDWAYAKIPHSIMWVVRDDGTLLGLTYVREQQMLAWHRHDFDNGTVENVVTVPEGTESAVYFVIKRTIDGATKRYLERFASRNYGDIEDAIFLDSSLSYDGRNTTATTMTVSGGTDWDYLETLTLTASASYFTAAEVGNEIHITDANGELVRFAITAYNSATEVDVKANRTVPSAMRNTATTDWSRAVDQLLGLWHLEGEDVSVFADGFVAASPNNEAYETVTVADGLITLDKAYAVIHVGLPITSDIETLDIDSPDGETLTDKKKLIQRVTFHVEQTRGLWIGPKPPEDETTDYVGGLVEVKARNNEGYDSPVELATKQLEVNIKAEWSDGGRVFIRQIDPLPASILAIAPSGIFPFKR